MDPKVWGDPENFRPERFLDEDNNVIRRNDIIPFGLGMRHLNITSNQIVHHIRLSKCEA